MRHIATIFSLSFALLASGASTACTANIHDNTVDVDAKVSINAAADVDVNNVTPGQSIPLTLKADNVTLVDPKEKPTTEQEHTAGHFSIFLDDDSTTALTVTASTSVSVTIPAKTPEGPHKLLCRLDKADGTPTSTEESLMINVKASASVSASTTTTTTVKPDAG
jgi:hypothetical protein